MIPQTYAITYTPPLRPKTAPSRSRTVQARQMRVKRTKRSTSARQMANLWLYMYNHRGPVDAETRNLCEIAESVERRKTRDAQQEKARRIGTARTTKTLADLRQTVTSLRAEVATLKAQIAATKTETEAKHDAPEQPEVLVQEVNNV